MRLFSRKIAEGKVGRLVDSSAFCEALLAFAVLDLHRRRLHPDVAFEIKEEIKTEVPFVKSNGMKIKADLHLALDDHSFGIAGEAVGARDTRCSDRHTISHGKVKDLFSRKESRLAYLAQKVICQLFPTVLELRVNGVAEPNIVAYYAVAKAHELNPLDALRRLRGREFVQAHPRIQMPKAFPLEIYKIEFGDLDGVLRRLGGNPARFRPVMRQTP